MKKFALFLAAGMVAAAAAAGGESAAPDGRLILSGESIWRGFIMWSPAVQKDANGTVTPARIWNSLGRASAPPPADWMEPGFDDTSWFYWREPHEARTLKAEDGADVPLRDPGQYGIQRSVYMGLRCFRTAFVVEDPGKVKALALTAAFRGGLVAYVNGKEIGRANLPGSGRPATDALADSYPDEVDGKADYKNVEKNVAELKRVNGRIRLLETAIQPAALRKGVNVLALEIHRAPFIKGQWNACGLVSVELRGDGAVIPAVARPTGVRVWNANSLTSVSPFGGRAEVRTWAGGGARARRFPLTWGMPGAKLGPVRIVGAKNGVFTGQVVVSSDKPIRGLDAAIGALIRSGGKGEIPAAAIQLRYQGYPSAFPLTLDKDPNTSLVDILYEKPPKEVPVRAEERKAGTPGPQGKLCGTWVDGGAVVPIWIKVRVSGDCQAGEYNGTLTIRAEGMKETAVPVKLQVADWVLPAPKEFVTHLGAMHSIDTLAAYYKTPPWSEEHLKLVEKTLAYCGEVGGKVAYVPLVVNTTWLHNDRSMVSLTKKTDGTYAYDFKLFDRYLDMVQKYLKPEVVCLYVTEGEGMTGVPGITAGDGGVVPLPAFEPKPESIAFWKPLIAAARERLEKRGLGEAAMIGVLWEQNTRDKGKAAVELFKEAAPGLKLVQIAHYGGQTGQNHGVPFGYTMSVWGNQTPVKSKVFGARDIPVKVAWHPRADAIHDIRFFGPRGAFRTVMERAATAAIGLGPVGMDFWNLPTTGTMEGMGAWNLSMSGQTTAAILAPGPDGPVTTVRFEQIREGLEECEARQFVEKALADPAAKAKLGDALEKRCRDMIAERAGFADFAGRGEWGLEGEGWQWFSASGWEDRSLKLFECAGDVSRALQN